MQKFGVQDAEPLPRLLRNMLGIQEKVWEAVSGAEAPSCQSRELRQPPLKPVWVFQHCRIACLKMI